MSKQPVVKPKTGSGSRPFSVSKDEAYARSLQDGGTDDDENLARQLQEEWLREQEASDADLARQLHEEEQSKQQTIRMPFYPAPQGRPTSATPIQQLFQTMFGLRPEALEVEDEEEDDEIETPAMDPNSPEASTAAMATGVRPSLLPTALRGGAAGRGEIRGQPANRRWTGRSPERSRRPGMSRSPERMTRGRGAGAAPVSPRRASTDSSSSNSNLTSPTDAQDPTVLDLLPGVRPNPGFRGGVGGVGRPIRQRRRIVVHSTNPEEADNPHNVRPIGLRPGLGQREATMNLPEGEFDPDFMVLDLGASERQREANFINIMRDPFLLMLLLMGRDPGFMVPDDVDLGDYEALWELAERLGEVRGRGMKEEEIEKLPCRTYRKKIGSKEKDEQCTICITEYKMGDRVQILPCQHEFHKDCLLEWLKRNASCPICRQDVKKNS